MKKTMRLCGQKLSRSVSLGDVVGSPGGEGTVYRLKSMPQKVAKVYHAGKGSRRKLDAMLRHPPSDPMTKHGMVSIAWPTDVVCDQKGTFRGFLMPYIKGETLYTLLSPKLRAEKHKGITYKHLLRIGRNLAASMEAIHDEGHYVSDVNSRNVVVNRRAVVTWIDCDSYHITAGGKVFRCVCYVPQYTPPEHQGMNPRDYDTTVEHDRFGLAVLLFQLLMEGIHPFEGSGPGKIHERITRSMWPYSSRTDHLRPRPASPTLEILHPELRYRFRRCFRRGLDSPERRPSCGSWKRALALAEHKTQRCPRVSTHFFGDHLSSCPWCRRARGTIDFDSFPT